MKNPAFTISCLLSMTAIAVALSLSSCTAVYSGVTGAPIPTVPVQRTDGTGKPFAVAQSDVIRAESQLAKIWGLYDAGFVAEATGQVIDSGK